jgi:hypothetical protein
MKLLCQQFCFIYVCNYFIYNNDFCPLSPSQLFIHPSDQPPKMNKGIWRPNSFFSNAINGRYCQGGGWLPPCPWSKFQRPNLIVLTLLFSWKFFWSNMVLEASHSIKIYENVRHQQVAWAWLKIDTFGPKLPLLDFKLG